VQRFSEDSANLDFLRSVAVMSVFFAHLSAFVRGRATESAWHAGQLGVLMFFVHTSLVLMMSLQRSKAEGSELFQSFYIRRLFRIYPLSAVCVFVVYFTGYRPSAHFVHVTWKLKDLFANLLLVQNLVYARDMIYVLWSLPIEVQMYIFLPFLFLLARKSRLRTFLLLWCAAVVVAIIQPHITGRLNLLSYAPCFIPGVIAWMRISKTRARLPGYLWPLAMAVISVIWFLSDRKTEMYYRWVFALVLGLAIPLFSEIPWTWVKAVAKTIAKYSYGVYLSHMFVMSIAFIVVRNRFSQSGVFSYFAQWSVFLLLAVLLPFAMYHLIEHPGIQLGKKFADRVLHPPKPKSAEAAIEESASLPLAVAAEGESPAVTGSEEVSVPEGSPQNTEATR
jgi:peptidoglycan/LPS O-acetylase OafA/YrhL